MSNTLVTPDLDCIIDYATDDHGWRPRGACRLRVWNDRRVAVVTELDDNPSMSITNAAEYVAERVRSITHRSITIVEHYPPASHRGATFDVVTIRPGQPPQWNPIKEDSALLGWLPPTITELDEASARRAAAPNDGLPSPERVAEILRNALDQREIGLILQPGEGLALIAQLQLALRHPANTGSSTLIVRATIETLAQQLPADLRPVIDAGFDPGHDVAR